MSFEAHGSDNTETENVFDIEPSPPTLSADFFPLHHQHNYLQHQQQHRQPLSFGPGSASRHLEPLRNLSMHPNFSSHIPPSEDSTTLPLHLHPISHGAPLLKQTQSLEEELREKTVQLFSKDHEIQALKAQVRQLQEENAASQHSTQALLAQLAQNAENIKMLEGQLHVKNGLIAMLQSRTL
jgi:hypothetical protein